MPELPVTNEARSSQAPVASSPPEEAAAATEARRGRRRRAGAEAEASRGDRAIKVIVVARCVLVLFAPPSDALADVVVFARGRAVSAIESCILERLSRAVESLSGKDTRD